MLITVPPMLPGLANAITPSIPTGGAVHLYVRFNFSSPSKRSVDTLSEQDISFLFGCFAGSTIFLVLSYLFPAQESFVEETKLAFGDDHPETKQACDNDKTSECSKREM